MQQSNVRGQKPRSVKLGMKPDRRCEKTHCSWWQRIHLLACPHMSWRETQLVIIYSMGLVKSSQVSLIVILIICGDIQC